MFVSHIHDSYILDTNVLSMRVRGSDASRSSRSTWGKSVGVNIATAPTSPANSSGGAVAVEDEPPEEGNPHSDDE